MEHEIDARLPNMRDEAARSWAPAIAAFRARERRAADATALLETHWTRVLHYDVFTAERDGVTERPTKAGGGSSGREEAGALARAIGGGSPIRAAAILLGVYAVMHLAVGGILHALHSPDAAAAVVGAPAHAADARDASERRAERPIDPRRLHAR